MTGSTKGFTVFPDCMAAPVKRQGLSDGRICVQGLHCVCVRPVSMIPEIGFLLINIILETQISIITSVIMIAFPLIISVTLHTGLWKLAPYFKEKRKKMFVTRLYVKKEL